MVEILNGKFSHGDIVALPTETVNGVEQRVSHLYPISSDGDIYRLDIKVIIQTDISRARR